MSRRIAPALALILLAFAEAAAAACVSFAGVMAGSACSGSSPELVWTNAPARPVVADVPRRPWEPEGCCYDPSIADVALRRGVYASGDADFSLRVSGRHAVEVALTVLRRGVPFSLVDSTGKLIGRYTPSVYWQPQQIHVGVVEGGSSFRVRTKAERYILSAVRWTPLERFERDVVPPARERARRLMQDPFADGPRVRPNFHIEQVLQRAIESRDEGTYREALLALARLTYWRLAEAAQEADGDRLITLVGEARRLAPGDPILKQVISAACTGINQPRTPGILAAAGFSCGSQQGVPWEPSVPSTPEGAPGWAVAQVRFATRLDAITRWWVANRMRPDGQVGGGWGDDVEMLRSWGPQALGFGSEIAALGLRRMAGGLWNSDILQHGYTKIITDAEHGAENTADTQPLLAAAFPEDAEILARLQQTSACARNWIVKQADGHWRFRGFYFNCREFDLKPERALDVHYNVRAMGPALWCAYLSRDRALTALIAKWAESWLTAMRSTRHGKPAGIIPSVLKSSDGSYLLGSGRWDEPAAEQTYHAWSGYTQEALTSLFLATHDLTGDRRWLDAAGETFQVLEQCEEHPRLCEEIHKQPQAFHVWRRLSGDARYDRYFTEMPRREVSQILSLMERQAKEMESGIARNFAMFTSEAIFTDRINPRWSPEYAAYLFGGDAPRGERYPSFAVTWPPTGVRFARAVIGANAHALRLRLYSFEPALSQVPVRLWRVLPGTYAWRARSLTGEWTTSGEFELTRRAQMIHLPLPSAQEVEISISHKRSSGLR